MEDGLIPAYAQDVSDSISPLLSRCFQSVSELSDEIISVSKTLTLAAPRHLPSVRHRKIKDSELSSLCKQSRKAWERWRLVGRPGEGSLYEEK